MIFFLEVSELNKKLNELSLKGSIRPCSHIKEHRCLKKVIHQTESTNEWLLLSPGLTAKSELVFFFVLTLGNAFS